MSTKDLSCLLADEAGQGRGSDLSGKRLFKGHNQVKTT